MVRKPFKTGDVVEYKGEVFINLCIVYLNRTKKNHGSNANKRVLVKMPTKNGTPKLDIKIIDYAEVRQGANYKPHSAQIFCHSTKDPENRAMLETELKTDAAMKKLVTGIRKKLKREDGYFFVSDGETMHMYDQFDFEYENGGGNAAQKNRLKFKWPRDPDTLLGYAPTKKVKAPVYRELPPGLLPKNVAKPIDGSVYVAAQQPTSRNRVRTPSLEGKMRKSSNPTVSDATNSKTSSTGATSSRAENRLRQSSKNPTVSDATNSKTGSTGATSSRGENRGMDAPNPKRRRIVEEEEDFSPNALAFRRAMSMR